MSESTTSAALTPVKRALLKIDALRRELADTRARLDEPIAIVGIGCRLPGGADSAEGLWQLVASGTDAVAEVPADRWGDELHDPRMGRADTFYCRRGAFIDGVDRFDPAFFGLSGREAHRLDPQQRLLLECTWRAMEDARFTASALHGSRTGVFVGSSLDDYARLSEAAEDAERSFAQTELGTARPFAAGRIAYLFGFHGPAMHLDTACSSSLVTMHLACQSLRQRECDLAFSGGANLMLSPEMTIALCELQALSPDGRCATFDAAANGYVRGEGAGVVALMRLSDARAQGRPIRAVIRGSAVNHDGRSNGMTAPNGRAQREVIREALARAGVAPGEVDYVEAHGTGTALGDPIELRALHDVYGCDVERTHDLHVGSIKTNIGHLEGAASVAALIKVVGALQHAALPPHLHFRTPTPHLDWETQRLRVPTALTAWPANRPGRRVAAISAFGMSGTNAHLVVEAWDDADADAARDDAPSTHDAAGASDDPQVLPVSAHTPAALARALEDLADHATGASAPSLGDLAHTLRTGRDARRLRAAIVASTPAEFADIARRRARAAASPASATAPLAFLFTGQGAQYAGMARRLYQACAAFRRTIDECDAAFEAETGESLVDVIYADDAPGAARIDETRWTQPALFAIELALARLWAHWGLRPQALIGHSVGEYAAACFAGVFSLADGIRLVAARGRLMQEMTAPGKMSIVLAPEDLVRPYLAPYAGAAAIACDNAPASVVVAGESTAHDDLVADLARAGFGTRTLPVSRAFHSPLMDPMLAAFREVARGISYSAPTMRVVSNVSAAFESRRLCDPEYWVEHVRATVRFREGLQTVLEDGAGLLLEVGPGVVLTGAAKDAAARHARAATIHCLASLDRKREDRRALLEALAAVAETGHEVDWAAVDAAFDAPRAPRRVALPPVPFDRGSYWVGTRRGATQARPFAVAGARAAADAGIAARGMLGEELRSPGMSDRRFQRRLALDALPLLRDHGFRDRIVFPAAGFAAMALEAARRLAPAAARIVVSDLSIDTPLVLDDAQAVTLASVVANAGAASRIDIHAGVEGQPGWTRHAGATLATDTPSADDDALPAADAPEAMDVDAFHAAIARTGLRYAGAFRALRSLRRGQAQAEGLVALDATDAAARWPVVHPAVLDNALQVVAAALWPSTGEEAGATAFLPVGIDRLEVDGAVDASRPLTARARVVARSPLVRADVDLADDAGRVVARLRGVRLAPVDARRLDGASVFEVRWQAREDRSGSAVAAPRALVIGVDGEGVDSIAGAAPKARVLRVPMADAAMDRAARRQAWAERLATALAGEERPDVIVYPWPMAEGVRSSDLTPNSTGANAEHGVRSEDLTPSAAAAGQPASGMPGSARRADPAAPASSGSGLRPDPGIPDDAHAVAAAHHRFADFWDALQGLALAGDTPRVTVVTHHAQALPGETPAVPAQAAAWGLVRGLMHEGEGAALALVDVASDDPASAAAAWRCIATAPAAEERQFLVRGERVFLPRLARVPAPAQPTADSQAPAGTWLVTGGRGAIGTRLVERLIARGAPRIVSASRALPAAAECERLADLAQAAGASLEFAPLDLADAGAVRSLVDRLAADAVHPLAGVLHAAGVLEDGLLRGQPDAAVERVLAPKVAGTLNLHRATAHLPLVQFLCFSSLVATIGSPGQCAYGAANAYVEALAAHRRAHGLAAQAIGWGLWAGDGMADRLDAAQRHRLDGAGIHALDPELALGTMDALVAGAASLAPALVVARLDPAALHARGASPGLRAMLAGLVPASRASPSRSGAGTDARPEAAGALAALARATAPQAREAVLVAHLGARLAAALQVSADLIGATTPLIEVGLDSLAATEFRATLRRELDVDIPFGRLLEGATLRDVVRAIEDRLASDARVAASPAAPSPEPSAPRDARPVRLAAVSAEATFGADMEAGEL